MTDFCLATGIFFLAYIVIVTERVHKTALIVTPATRAGRACGALV